MAIKRILIVSNTSWSLFNFRLSLMHSLRNAGYEIIAVAPKDEYSQRLSEHGFEYHPIWMNNKGTDPLEDIKTLKMFYSLYKHLKPDMILHYTIKPNIYGTLASHILGIKTINNIAGLGTLFIKENFATKIAILLYKISQSYAGKIFFQNKDDYNLFINKHIVKREKSDILPGSGVDTQKFKPINIKREENIFRFLLVARMLWDKGIGEYVESARIIKEKYPNVTFQLLGFLDVQNQSAISKDQMDKWVKDGLVEYLGTSDNVSLELSKADCVVLPSYYREGTPRTLLEAASMEKPIITTDNVGCRDVVENGKNGYICKIKDPLDLAAKMEAMLKLSADERRLMGTYGRKKMVLEYDENIVVSAYLNTIQNLLR